MGSAVKMKVSTSEPCHICGKPDWCFRLVFGTGSVLHCCARSTDKAIGAYVLIKTKDTDIGEYGYYKDRQEYEAYIRSLGKEYRAPKAKELPINTEKSSELIEGEVPVREPVFLDAVYRRFLDMLILEDWHIKRLKADWNTESTGELFERVIKTYPIKSLPPADWVRTKPKFTDGHKNQTRAMICNALISEFGSLAGVPGFYEEDGKWSFSGSEGILFPILNEEGKIIRVRVRDDYPSISGTLNNNEGTYVHSYSKMGTHSWKFIVKSTGEKIQLPDQPMLGLPNGKANNKYKNFTSVYEKMIESDGKKKVVNGYQKNGSRSGSNISLYCKEGDDFSVVYVTEGEKKAIVSNMLQGVPVISLPGTGTFSKLFEKNESGISMMDYLVSKGMKLCIIAYDADKKENIRVLQSEQKAVQEFLKRGLRIAIGEWNPNWGKGLDDTLVLGVRPQIYHVT